MRNTKVQSFPPAELTVLELPVRKNWIMSFICKVTTYLDCSEVISWDKRVFTCSFLHDNIVTVCCWWNCEGLRGRGVWLMTLNKSLSLCSSGPLSSIRAVIKRSELCCASSEFSPVSFAILFCSVSYLCVSLLFVFFNVNGAASTRTSSQSEHHRDRRSVHLSLVISFHDVWWPHLLGFYKCF